MIEKRPDEIGPVQSMLSGGRDWYLPLPATSAACLTAMGLTNVAFWRPDLWTSGDLVSLGNVTATLLDYGTPVRLKKRGRFGVHLPASGDTFSNLFSDATLRPAALSFVFAWVGTLQTDTTGTQHTAIAHASAGNHGWIIFFEDTGDLIAYFSDGAGNTKLVTLASAVCPVGAEPICLVGQVDWSGGGDPIFRARWSREGKHLGSCQETLTGVTTLTAASSEFGIGGQPGIIASGQSDGSGCWHHFAAMGLPGAQCGGVTKALTVSQGLRFEPSYSAAETVTVCIGDSITVGAGDSTSRGGYRSRLNKLKQSLRMVGTRTTTFGFHEGISGQVISDISARINKIPMQNASTVILMAGTNDIGTGRTSVQVLGDLVTLAEALKALAGVTRVLVSTIPPRNDAFTAVTAAVNSGLQAALSGATAGIEYVNGCAGLVNPTHFDVDGLHPNAAGYDIIAANLAGAF